MLLMLEFICQDILDVRQNLARINGLLAVNAACVVFNISVMTLVGKCHDYNYYYY